jgi:hypothetical protein
VFLLLREQIPGYLTSLTAAVRSAILEMAKNPVRVLRLAGLLWLLPALADVRSSMRVVAVLCLAIVC